MGATQTQQLAQIADLDQGPPTSAMVQALSMYDSTAKNTYLRRASGHVLAAYGKRMTLPLAQWGDFTIDLVVSLARWFMISDRGYNEKNPADAAIKARADAATKTLDEIVDLTNKTPRMDPDVIDSTPALDEEGPLNASEGGDFDESSGWASNTGPTPALLGIFS